jgi:hypothetical protein
MVSRNETTRRNKKKKKKQKNKNKKKTKKKKVNDIRLKITGAGLNAYIVFETVDPTRAASNDASSLYRL